MGMDDVGRGFARGSAGSHDDVEGGPEMVTTRRRWSVVTIFFPPRL